MADATTQLNTDVPLFWQFYLPTTGAPYAPVPAPTGTVYRLNEDGTRTQLVAPGAVLTAIAGLTGAYTYALDDSLNTALGQLIGQATTTDTALTPYPEYVTRNYDVEVQKFTFNADKVNATATLDEDALDQLDAIQAKTDTLGTATVTVVSPLTNSITLALVRGDSYEAIDGRSFDFTFTGQPSLIGATGTLRFASKSGTTSINLGTSDTPVYGLTAEILSATTVRFEMTSAQSACLNADSLRFEVSFVLSDGNVITPTPLNKGNVSVAPQAAP